MLSTLLILAVCRTHVTYERVVNGLAYTIFYELICGYTLHVYTGLICFDWENVFSAGMKLI